ncbi:MAG: hypothetical protein IPH20_11095 [Bacteroidales bacterium]|nr:hypothetical protein [Bacteroidales bacterium]
MRLFDKLRILYPALILFAIIFFSCTKEKDEPLDNGSIKITSLTTSDTSLIAWIDTANIVIVASGDDLDYEWSCNHGTLRGSGSNVKYTAGECCVGLNTITCRVFNDSSSVSRDINIRITSYFDQ